MQDTTLIVKSFLRPHCVERLLQSIAQFYPDLPVIVADDSDPATQERIAQLAHTCVDDRLTFLKLPFDVGLSAGRNRLVDAARTPYVILFDDDFVLTNETRLDVLVEHLRADKYDLVGGSWILPDGQIEHFEGYMELTSGILRLSPLEQYKRHQGADIVLNFFAAKTDMLKAIRWDENLKQSEHFDFFLQCQQHRVRVGYEPTVNILHDKQMPEDYKEFRMRFIHDRQLMFKKWGITEIQGWPQPKKDEDGELEKIMI
jgi:hypothetical protein